jgi:hypothetical protein
VIRTLNLHTKHANRLKFTPDKLVLVSDLRSGDLVVLDATLQRNKRVSVASVEAAAAAEVSSAFSGLNPPHICVLHDVGSQDGIDYLDMECVEGETLSERLEKGFTPLRSGLENWTGNC